MRGLGFLKPVPALLLVAVAFGAPAAVERAVSYVCPECACADDGKTYDRPGRCEACGMNRIRTDEGRNVAILVFEGVQIIDYTGPYEVFGQVGPFHVYTVSKDGETLSTAMGMSINPSYSFENAPAPDILVVPGGAAHVAYDDETVVRWVRERAAVAEYVLSVCNGAFILARAGLLDGLRATTFYGLIDDLREFAPHTEVVTDRRFVDNGKVITSAGLSSGIDASLHLVSRIRGEARAKHLALHLEYDWDPHSDFARAALADLRLPRIDPPPGAQAVLVATAGDRDHWERRYRIDPALSPGRLRRHLVAEMESLDGWSRIDDAAGAADGAGSWAHGEASGDRWIGTIRVTREDDAQLVTLRVERAPAPRADAQRTPR